MKRLIMALVIAGLGLTLSGTAGAFTQTATGTINVDATILPSCSVTTAPLSFGSGTGTAAVYANTTITVNCSSGAPYRIDIDAGQNLVSPQDTPRRVKTGTAPADFTNTVSYHLAKIAGGFNSTNYWGDNGATFCTTCTTVPTGKDGVGIGADEVHTVYGMLGTTAAAAGVYTDTLTVTVNY